MSDQLIENMRKFGRISKDEANALLTQMEITLMHFKQDGEEWDYLRDQTQLLAARIKDGVFD